MLSYVSYYKLTIEKIKECPVIWIIPNQKAFGTGSTIEQLTLNMCVIVWDDFRYVQIFTIFGLL